MTYGLFKIAEYRLEKVCLASKAGLQNCFVFVLKSHRKCISQYGIFKTDSTYTLCTSIRKSIRSKRHNTPQIEKKIPSVI